MKQIILDNSDYYISNINERFNTSITIEDLNDFVKHFELYEICFDDDVVIDEYLNIVNDNVKNFDCYLTVYCDNCRDCHNCYNCTDCLNSRDCVDCDGCVMCRMCNDCENCYNASTEVGGYELINCVDGRKA